MESILLALAFLACPVGMGLMMWFMAKGMRKDEAPQQPRVGASAEQLREEHRRLGAEIERVDGRPADTAVGRS
jgi:flagellar basal body-associated protein FliL